MSEEPLAAGVDLERANAARMYDYLLGGAHNFAVDRERAQQVIAAQPDSVFIARANRSFLARVVRWCLERGVRQFLDLGSGVPTVGNVHEIVHRRHRDARVAYVDFEPVAVAHAQQVIDRLDTSTVTVTRADARDPAGVLAAPGVAGLLDFDQPIALLAVAVLHFIEGDIAALLARYRRALAAGSVIGLSHASDDQPDDPDAAEQLRSVRAAYANSATPLTWRDRTQLHAALHGLELVPPGVVDVLHWPAARDTDRRSRVYGAVALVP